MFHVKQTLNNFDMTDPSIIFHRTNAGRDEIHQKSHGLTQSERLVLIMVDGVSTFQEIRAKLPVLSDERFDRALQKLQYKELVLEVFMPLDGQAPDELERTVIDRFLQQDPMDPVTVMLQDPEEFDLIEQANTSPRELIHDRGMVEAVVHQPEPDVRAPERQQLSAPRPARPPAPPISEPAIDAHHALMADSFGAELRAIRAARPVIASYSSFVGRQDAAPAPVLNQHADVSPLLAVHWGYWLIVSGLSFILGFVLARITS